MQINTKFDLGSTAWMMHSNKITEISISAINIFEVKTNQSYIKYSAKDAVNPVTWIDYQHLNENILFHSKAALINSLSSGKCGGFDIGNGELSGCDTSNGDCLECGK